MAKKKAEKFDIEKLKKTADGKYIIKLKTPINYGNELIVELEVDEPRAKHVRAMSHNPDINETLQMIGKLICQPDSFVDELGLKDMDTLSEFIDSFS